MDNYNPSDATSDNRLRGVSVSAVGSVLLALLNSFLFLNTWIRSEELGERQLLALLYGGAALVSLVIAFGVWRLHEWARLLGIGFYLLYAGAIFLLYFNEPLTSVAAACLILPVAIAIYLMQPHVSSTFL